MAVDPNISLEVKPVQAYDPTAAVTKGIALRDMMTQQALRTQQIAQSQAQTADINQQVQQRQRDLADEKTWQQSLLANNGDWDKSLASIKGQVTPGFQLKAETQRQSLKENLAKANKADVEMHYEMLGKVDNALSGLSNFAKEKPDEADTQYSATIQRLSGDKDLGPIIQQMKTSGQLPSHYDPDTLNQLHSEVVGRKGIIDEANKDAQTNQYASRAKEADTAAAKNTADLPKVAADAAQAVTSQLAARLAAEPDATKRQAMIDEAPHGVAKLFEGKTTDQIRTMGQNDEQQVQQQDKLREMSQKDTDITTAKGRLMVEQGRLALEKAKQDKEMGPKSTQVWIDTLKKNPDAVSEIPPLLKNGVAEGFQQQTGLPMPKAASQNSQNVEISAHNALSNASYILKAIEDPDIRARLGPILGRLGETEQKVGETFGLPADKAQKAQELRTRLRYFVFQESKALLGGRLPQQLVEQLKGSSADVHMNEAMFKGALKGAVDTAKTNLDNVDAERFGGSAARPRVLRGVDPEPGSTLVNPTTKHRIATDNGGKSYYDAETGEPVK